ncbi:MAG: tRNA (adenosine(37)-N6)-threonylcarbamoyltransferase complex dimerization subunit type 1 TsaB [Burkholderiales bacterium]|nr:tRNA (adenosine(37)-N6)-threonylcarbamoyltransferase complex dimerization subunit type 1 TsaB [Burkholderiales bacterium]
MNLLAFDTSTEYLSIALRYKGERIDREWPAQQLHAEMALPEASRLLADAGASWADLDGIAVSTGPGSFTGLRIGCGIVQGLAFGLDIPTVGVNTLAALAADQDADRVLTVLDARMGEFYLAGFARNTTGWDEVLETTVVGPQNLPALPGNGWTGVGSGFTVADGLLAAHYGAAINTIVPGCFPHARGVLALAERAFAAGQGHAPDQLQLVYVRDKVALKTSERART